MSLFTGSGMLDRALMEFAPGSELVLMCERDLYARALLMARVPGVPIDPDVTTLVDRVQPGQADAVVFGSPCQDLSVANVHTRTGLAGEKSGLFWNAVDVVRKVHPSVVLVENVPQGRDVMLPALRQTVPWLNWGAVTVPASAVGYPHYRNRVFILGYEGELQPVVHVPGRRNGLLPTPVATDSRGGGAHRIRRLPDVLRQRDQPGVAALIRDAMAYTDKGPAPEMSEVGPRGGVRLSPRFTEWMMGMPEGWVSGFSFETIPWTQQLKIIGNAVVKDAALRALRELTGKEYT